MIIYVHKYVQIELIICFFKTIVVMQQSYKSFVKNEYTSILLFHVQNTVEWPGTVSMQLTQGGMPFMLQKQK